MRIPPNEIGVNDLEMVRPKRVFTYIEWADAVDYKNAGPDISMLNVFFKWAVCSGHRKSSSPVVPEFHGKKRPHYLPPYSDEEMAFLWRLAHERGNARVLAVLAIGEEAGLQLGEICRLRLGHVDLDGRRLFVDLPNNTDTQRWALFSDKAAEHIASWLSERDSGCNHDSLLHGR